jgi:hypothetical protein
MHAVQANVTLLCWCGIACVRTKPIPILLPHTQTHCWAHSTRGYVVDALPTVGHPSRPYAASRRTQCVSAAPLKTAGGGREKAVPHPTNSSRGSAQECGREQGLVHARTPTRRPSTHRRPRREISRGRVTHQPRQREGNTVRNWDSASCRNSTACISPHDTNRRYRAPPAAVLPRGSHSGELLTGRRGDSSCR